MRKLACLTFLMLAILALAPAAHAQATRTWVSGVGDDVNPCSRTAPCKTYAGAISKTAPGGEISTLDPGGFGAVTITKAITINGDGTLAGILAAGTTGVIVNAGVNDRVVLRNISINGAGTGISGIRFLAGKSLTVDKVNISGFTNRGIDVALTASASNLFVRDTTITNAPTGIKLNTTTGFVLASLDRVHLQGLTNGLEAALGGRATINNSYISGNSANGILTSAANSIVNAENSQISFNDLTGVNCSVSGGTVRLSNNAIYNNSTGISFSAGCSVSSANNNRDFGNTSTNNPAGTPIVVH